MSGCGGGTLLRLERFWHAVLTLPASPPRVKYPRIPLSRPASPSKSSRPPAHAAPPAGGPGPPRCSSGLRAAGRMRSTARAACGDCGRAPAAGGSATPQRRSPAISASTGPRRRRAVDHGKQRIPSVSRGLSSSAPITRGLGSCRSWAITAGLARRAMATFSPTASAGSRTASCWSAARRSRGCSRVSSPRAARSRQKRPGTKRRASDLGRPRMQGQVAPHLIEREQPRLRRQKLDHLGRAEGIAQSCRTAGRLDLVGTLAHQGEQLLAAGLAQAPFELGLLARERRYPGQPARAWGRSFRIW